MDEFADADDDGQPNSSFSYKIAGDSADVNRFLFGTKSDRA